MHITYDKETDTLNIIFAEGHVVDSEYMESKGVIVDYGEEDFVMGIEILSYSKRLTDGFEVDLPVAAVRGEARLSTVRQ